MSLMDLDQTDLSELAEPKETEKVKPGSDKSYRLAKYWHDQLDSCNDEYKKWVKRGTSIERRYRDERSKSEEDSTRRVNNLWANVQILYPALYGKTPQPIAERRFRDKDPVGRGAAQILERALRNEIEISGYDEAISQSVMDYLLPGRGTVWVRYEPEIGPGISIPVEDEMDMRDDQGDILEDEGSEGETKLRETGDRITRESTPVDYIQWTDFFVFPAKARIWKEVTAVGKRVYMTRDQMIRRFGEKIGEDIPLEKDDRERKRLNESIHMSDETGRKGAVYEIWSRADEHVYWIAEGYDYLCDYQPDPLGLDGFFPTPRPLMANATTNTLIPVPDFVQYQDQAVQIDDLTQRISMLTRACAVKGVYNAAADGIKRMLDESAENELIPVDDWAAFAEKGGVEGNISWLPLKDIVGALNELIAVKKEIVAEMDRLTGITDIIRGTTDARETLGAQRLKQNSQGTRLQRRQNEVARFCRDTIRIMAELMSEHFSPQSLIEMSGALFQEGLGVIDETETLGAQAPGGAPPAAGSLLPPAQGSAPGPALNSPLQGAGPAPAPPSPGGPAQPPGLPMMQSPPLAPGAPMGAPGGLPGPGGIASGPMGPPPGPMGMPPGLPPELMARVEGLKRIAAAIQLLRNEKLRGFRVDIETDSTIFGDNAQEKQDRIEFIAEVTKFLQTSSIIATQMPQATPLLGKMLQFGVRGFRVGRDLEVAIEDFTDEAEKLAKKAAANPQPTPEQQKAQADVAKAQMQIQQGQQKLEMDQQKMAHEGQQKQIESQVDLVQAHAEVERQQLENQGDQIQAQSRMQDTQGDMAMRQMEMEIEKLKLQIEYAKLQATSVQARTDKHVATTDHKIAQVEQKTAAHKAKTAAAEARKPKPKAK